jgi:polyphosphate glucokinase
MAILAVDVGGSHVKVLLEGETERRRFPSGREMTSRQMVDGVLAVLEGWSYDRVSVGVPTTVRGGKVVAEPVNLGGGWVGFDFDAAFGAETKIVNDAVLQAIGSYDGGRMLFLGLGTGLGSAVITDGVIEPLELGHLPYRTKTFEDYVSKAALRREGKKKWRETVFDVVARLSAALEPDYVVIGGSGVESLDQLPPNSRRGSNALAFVGGFRLWQPEWASAR